MEALGGKRREHAHRRGKDADDDALADQLPGRTRQRHRVYGVAYADEPSDEVGDEASDQHGSQMLADVPLEARQLHHEHGRPYGQKKNSAGKRGRHPNGSSIAVHGAVGRPQERAEAEGARDERAERGAHLERRRLTAHGAAAEQRQAGAH